MNQIQELGVSDPSLRLAMKSALRRIGCLGHEMLVPSTGDRMEPSLLELHLESWRAALAGETGSNGWVFIIDAQVQFSSDAAVQFSTQPQTRRRR